VVRLGQLAQLAPEGREVRAIRSHPEVPTRESLADRQIPVDLGFQQFQKDQKDLMVRQCLVIQQAQQGPEIRPGQQLPANLTDPVDQLVLEVLVRLGYLSFQTVRQVLFLQVYQLVQ